MMNLDRFSHAMSTELAAPMRKGPYMGDSGLYCITCGRELKYIEYPETDVEYHGQTYGTGGGSELYCPRGCQI